MGNTDSKLNVLYRDHVFKLARPDVELIYNPNEKVDKSTHNVIPLFNSDLTLERLSSLYLGGSKKTDNDQIFAPFYLDFISAGNSLTMELFNKLITHQELRFIYNVNPTNFCNLLRFTALKIYLLSCCLDTESNANLEQQLVQLLVCTRILTKIIPIYLEKRGNVDIFWTRDATHIFGDLVASSSNDGNSPVQPLPPLGSLLVKACIKLLFVEGFTITSMGSPGSMTALLWENGVSTQDCSYHNQTPKVDANRLEIVNLLLALCSSDLYRTNSLILGPKKSNKASCNNFLYFLSKLSPEYDVICLTASIINLTCRYCSNYHEENTLPYNNLGFKNSQQQQLASLTLSLVHSSLQLLNLLCFNSWDQKQMLDFALSLKLVQLDNNDLPSNIALSFLATLTREIDFKLILSSFARIFKLPIDLAVEQESNPLSFPSRKPSSASGNDSNNHTSSGAHNNDNHNNNSNNHNASNGNNYGANNHSTGHSVTNSSHNHNTSNEPTNDKSNNSMALPQVPPLLSEVLIFFTNLIQENKLFENYIADKFANKIVIFSVYYIIFYEDNPQLSATLIPLCYNLALLLTSKKLVLSKMLETFTPNYYTNKLPNFFKLSTGSITNITYRDFTIIHLCNTAISNARDNVQPRPWLFEIIYNLIPISSTLKDEELAQTSSKKHPKNLVNGGLSYNASMSILNLLSKLTIKSYLTVYASNMNDLPKPCYLISPGFKLDTIALILRAMSTYIILYFNEARNLLFALCRHQRVLFQVRDTIETITKALQGRGDIEGVKIQLRDYFEYSMNPRSTANEVNFVRKGYNPTGKQELTTQNIVFDKSKNTAYQTECSVDDFQDGLDDVNEIASQGDASDLESLNLELTKTHSNLGKTLEMVEQADLSRNILMSNREIFFKTRPKWPIGITIKSKVKKNSKLSLSDSWTGAHSLSLLMRITKIMLRRFPSITTITTTEYYNIIAEMGTFKDKFDLVINPTLPLYIRVLKEIEPLKLDLSIKNETYQQWLYMLIWADTFTTHSGFYSISNSFANLGTISDINNVLNLPSSSANDNIAECNTPTAPNLERWNSNGSGLSRTNSNGSSLMGYFASQNNDFVPNSPLDTTTVRHVSSPKLKNARNKTNNVDSGHSFFNFSWTGFNKNDHYSPINEQGQYKSSSSQSNGHRAYIFTLDTGILKPNTWAGTNVKLFDIRKEEKEEFSFLDMTSSLLKRFRIGSNVSVNSLESITTSANHSSGNPNGVNNTTSPLTPTTSSPRLQRDRATSNFALFATPKQL